MTTPEKFKPSTDSPYYSSDRFEEPILNFVENNLIRVLSILSTIEVLLLFKKYPAKTMEILEKTASLCAFIIKGY